MEESTDAKVKEQEMNTARQSERNFYIEHARWGIERSSLDTSCTSENIEDIRESRTTEIN